MAEPERQLISYEVRLGDLRVGEASLELEPVPEGVRYHHAVDLTIGGMRARRDERGLAHPDYSLINERATSQTGDDEPQRVGARVEAPGLVRDDGAFLAADGPLVCSALLSRFAAARWQEGGAVEAALVATTSWRIIHTVLVPTDSPPPAEAIAFAAGREILSLRHTTDTATITTHALRDGAVLVEEVSNGLRILCRSGAQ